MLGFTNSAELRKFQDVLGCKGLLLLKAPLAWPQVPVHVPAAVAAVANLHLLSI